MKDDAELLRRYTAEKSEEAFAELVRRHLNLVYSVALRQVAGDTHLAQDVTQQVFTALARKAASLAGRPALSGWLYRSAHFAASDIVRAERRRRAREQEVQAMNLISTDPTPPADWDKIRPTLDAAIAELDERDRDAVALRFFDGHSFADLSVKLRLTENAARMRVERALDKLQAALTRRGINSTAAALGVVLVNQVAIAAPAGLAASVAGVALTGAMVNGGGAGIAATFMGSLKFQVGVVVAIAAAGTTGVVTRSRANAELRAEISLLRERAQTVSGLQRENQRLVALAAELDALRRDDAEFKRLRDQVAVVKSRQEEATRAEANAAQSVYSEQQVEQQPKPRYQKRPTYPFAMRRYKMNGEAVVSFVVNADGTVRDVEAVSSTHSDFAAAAVKAIKEWQFDPGKKSGLPVNVRVTTPVRFTLDDHSKPVWSWF